MAGPTYSVSGKASIRTDQSWFSSNKDQGLWWRSTHTQFYQAGCLKGNVWCSGTHLAVTVRALTHG